MILTSILSLSVTACGGNKNTENPETNDVALVNEVNNSNKIDAATENITKENDAKINKDNNINSDNNSSGSGSNNTNNSSGNNNINNNDSENNNSNNTNNSSNDNNNNSNSTNNNNSNSTNNNNSNSTNNNNDNSTNNSNSNSTTNNNDNSTNNNNSNNNSNNNTESTNKGSTNNEANEAKPSNGANNKTESSPSGKESSEDLGNSGDLAAFPNVSTQSEMTFYTAEDGSQIIIVPYNDAIDDSMREQFNNQSPIFSAAFKVMLQAYISSLVEEPDKVTLLSSGFEEIAGHNVYAFSADIEEYYASAYLFLTEEGAYVILGIDMGTEVEGAMNSLLDTL
ncbi:hypothetical protein LJC58_07490 [Lachnospiraceae bacterium OttesenSCG-928-D06]|nr:hypothetical protein [Lachnospiraceae bacterium OttesenSCG-928-D06]